MFCGFVEPKQLEPGGWICEGCSRPFQAGEMYYGRLVAMSAGALPIEGDYRCYACEETDVEVL
jgi:hypothetical protein